MLKYIFWCLPMKASIILTESYNLLRTTAYLRVNSSKLGMIFWQKTVNHNQNQLFANFSAKKIISGLIRDWLAKSCDINVVKFALFLFRFPLLFKALFTQPRASRFYDSPAKQLRICISTLSRDSNPTHMYNEGFCYILLELSLPPQGFGPARCQNPRRHPSIPRVYTYKEFQKSKKCVGSCPRRVLAQRPKLEEAP